MNINMVWMGSDILWFLFLAMVCVSIFYIVNDEFSRKRWSVLFTVPKNFIATCFILIFVIIALLDSIHYVKQNGERHQVYSLLDDFLYPLQINNEKSYSAPFSIYSYNQENIVNEDHEVVRKHTRLEHAGAFLNSEKDHIPDIYKRIKKVLIQTMLIGAMLSILFGFFLNRKNVFPIKTSWLLIFLITFCILFVKEFKWTYHILGTNKIGEDVFYQCVKSIRTGMIIGTLTTFLILPFAIFLGLVAGYFKGKIDDVVQYLYTTVSAIPAVLLIAAMVLSLQIFMSQHQEWFSTANQRADIRLIGLCAILGLTSWTGLCRLIRAEAFKLSSMDFINAAKILGTSKFNILVKHLLPNVGHIILISIALDFSGLVLSEAVLSYVGVGVDPNTNSWGSMINSARLEMAREPVVWWNLLGAFVFMFLLVLNANLFADGVRDVLDPRVNKAVLS